MPCILRLGWPSSVRWGISINVFQTFLRLILVWFRLIPTISHHINMPTQQVHSQYTTYESCLRGGVWTIFIQASPHHGDHTSFSPGALDRVGALVVSVGDWLVILILPSDTVLCYVLLCLVFNTMSRYTLVIVFWDRLYDPMQTCNIISIRLGIFSKLIASVRVINWHDKWSLDLILFTEKLESNLRLSYCLYLYAVTCFVWGCYYWMRKFISQITSTTAKSILHQSNTCASLSHVNCMQSKSAFLWEVR